MILAFFVQISSALATTIITTLPTITMPTNVDAGHSITARWNRISRATGYTIALLDQTDGTKPINDRRTSSTSYTISSSLLKPNLLSFLNHLKRVVHLV